MTRIAFKIYIYIYTEHLDVRVDNICEKLKNIENYYLQIIFVDCLYLVVCGLNVKYFKSITTKLIH